MTATIAAGATAVGRRAIGSLAPIAWLAAVGGTWLVYAALTGQSPTASVRAALTGAPAPGRTTGSFAALRTDVSRETSVPRETSASSPGKPSVLVAIGQGSHKLTPAAAGAFAAWERAYGGRIPISDSYRDYEEQLRQHRKDPARFVHPDKSAHPRGEAVDVDLSRVNETRLVTAATASGWCQSAKNKKAMSEPWHFSYNGCR